MKQRLEEAKGRAEPRWEAAEEARVRAEGLKKRIKALERGDEKDAWLREQLAKQEDTARAEQAAGDALYNAAFNLDISNPATEEKVDTRGTAQVLGNLLQANQEIAEALAQLQEELLNA